MAKVVHVITSLEVGGAESVLRRLVEGGSGDMQYSVVSLSDEGPIGRALQEKGLQVHALNIRRNPFAILDLLRLVRLLRRARPDVVQTWMYHADLVGGFAARLAGAPRLIWSLRQTLVPAQEKRLTLAIARLCAWTSRVLPKHIVSCSAEVAEGHAAFGYDRGRMLVINNGFDLDRFRPDPEARARIRAELGLPADAQVVGMIGRFREGKNHRGFFEAARTISQALPGTRFLLAGPNVTDDEPDIRSWLEQQPRPDAFRLLGYRADVPDLLNALDVLVSPGAGEGFPNIVAEAMACGTPCAAVDAGSSVFIIGGAGRTAACGDMAGLAAGVVDLLGLDEPDRQALKAAARQRIAENFTLAQMIDRFEALYRGSGASPGSPRS